MRGIRERRKGKQEKAALDMISPTSFYSSLCPNRCISEKDAFCTIFDDKHMFR
jgi:hypothetical protein